MIDPELMQMLRDLHGITMLILIVVVIRLVIGVFDD